jgi:hypothetical protein
MKLSSNMDMLMKIHNQSDRLWRHYKLSDERDYPEKRSGGNVVVNAVGGAEATILDREIYAATEVRPDHV